jgi:hypothetical protein
MMRKTAITQDEHDRDGNLLKIVVHDADGGHIFDALWDERDAQTHENRQNFRKWVRGMLRKKGYHAPD